VHIGCKTITNNHQKQEKKCQPCQPKVSTMQIPKIKDIELVRMIDRDKLTQAEAARKLGVSRQAVSKRLQELRGQTTKALAISEKKIKQVVNQKINAMEQLQKINRVSNKMLDELTGDNKTIDRMVKAADLILNYEGDTSKQKEKIKAIILQVNNDKNTALKACAEIRNQLKLQLDIFQTLYDLQAAEEFQNTVVEAIGEVSPDVRDRIIQELNEKRAVRSAVKFT
jgi:predicted DNA-binding protein (UPF0251 family)